MPWYGHGSQYRFKCDNDTQNGNNGSSLCDFNFPVCGIGFGTGIFQ